MPWLLKALVLALKSKRARDLLIAGALGAVEIARSERARELYAHARDAAADAAPRQKAGRLAKEAVVTAKRVAGSAHRRR
jgi:hypothetical protein